MRVNKVSFLYLETYEGNGNWFCEASWSDTEEGRSLAIEAYDARKKTMPRHGDCLRLRLEQRFSEVIRGWK